MHGEIMSKTNMVKGVGMVVKLRTIPQIIDSRTITMLKMIDLRILVCCWIHTALIIQGIEFGAIVRIYCRKVGEELGREQVVPVESHIEVPHVNLERVVSKS